MGFHSYELNKATALLCAVSFFCILPLLSLLLDANLVLLQSPVDSVSCHVVCLMDDDLLSQGAFSLMQPRPHHIQRSWQRPVQLQMPVQELKSGAKQRNTMS